MLRRIVMDDEDDERPYWLEDWLSALLLVILVSTLANSVMLLYFLKH